MKQFSASRRLAGLILICVHAAALLAGFIAPYDPVTQNRRSALLPPMRVHFFDANGTFHLRPFVVAAETKQVQPLRFCVSGAPYRLLGLRTLRTHLFGVDEPGQVFLLGTDEFGRDQLSRILLGGQISLWTGWVAAFLSLSLGLMLGAIAGFFSGWRDAVIMRGAELFLALPWLYLLPTVRAFLPLSMSTGATALVLVAVIGLVGWARPALLVRGIILSSKEREYVYAARGFGASSWYLLTRHCLPETRGVMATQAALLVPQYILAEVALSFLGLGVGEPTPSWGNLLAPLRQVSVLSETWWIAIPALFVMLTAWSFLSLEDAFAKGKQTQAEWR